MKKLLVCLLSVALTLSLAACNLQKEPAATSSSSAAATSAPTATPAPTPKVDEDSPQYALERAFEAFKKADTENLEKYFAEGDSETADTQLFKSDSLNDISDEDRELFMQFTKNFTYKAGECTETGETAVIKTEISNTNLSTMFTDLISHVFTATLTNPEQPEAEIEGLVKEKLREMITDTSRGIATKTVDVNLVRQDGAWKVKLDTATVDAMLGGMLAPMEGMLGSLEKLQGEK